MVTCRLPFVQSGGNAANGTVVVPGTVNGVVHSAGLWRSVDCFSTVNDTGRTATPTPFWPGFAVAASRSPVILTADRSGVAWIVTFLTPGGSLPANLASTTR